MKVNIAKSNVIHFRPKSKNRTETDFLYNNERLELVSQYKYLGVVFDEFLDYTITAGILANSAGRALGSIYNKFKQNKGLGYTTSRKLYDSCVTPIFDYCTGVWGYNKLEKIDTIQNKAIRLYLGVHGYAPNKAINADMGWVSCRVRRHVQMLRLVNMNDSKIARRIFDWDKEHRGWCINVKDILMSVDSIDYFHSNRPIDLESAKRILYFNECQSWKEEVHNVPKLRTYILNKDQYGTEAYTFIINQIA